MLVLRIGILVNTLLKQQYLDDLVVQAGHQIGYSNILDHESRLPSPSEMDAWVIDLVDTDDANSGENQHASIMQLLVELLEQTQIPVILNEDIEFQQGCAEHQNWVRRMLQRLERLTGDINLQQVSSATEVWVLAASTGGPAAVKDFLKSLPEALNIAFVYVQHIDSGQAETLIKMMNNAGHYPSSIAKQGTVLTNNTLTLMTTGRSVSIHDNGTLVFSPHPWAGFYAPSIDQVAANVARVYRHNCGIIMFTGMGDDGAASCRLIKQQGGKVWAQTPANCTSASMPDSAIATQSVSLVGTPQELAAALTRLKTLQKYNRSLS